MCTLQYTQGREDEMAHWSASGGHAFYGRMAAAARPTILSTVTVRVPQIPWQGRQGPSAWIVVAVLELNKA